MYRHDKLTVFIYAYVDDLLVTGREDHITVTMDQLSQELLLKHTGQLQNPGDNIRLLGRTLQRTTDGIHIFETPDYYEKIFEEYNLQNSRSVNAPGISSLKPDESVELLST